MGAILKTNIREYNSIIIKESVKAVHKLLVGKERFLALTRISLVKTETPILIDKSAIKLVLKRE